MAGRICIYELGIERVKSKQVANQAIIVELEVKEIFAVVKQLKQSQIKPRKNSEAPTGFEPVTPVIPV